MASGSSEEHGPFGDPRLAPSLQKRLAYIPLSPAVSQHLSARRLELSAHADNGRKKKPDGVEGN